ncbi:hypothetical protein CLAFUW4_05532 [Fulvia fulva]|uniref:RING-type domain-containing protein n=1 Tax=Passalora fulva TaxID=5499 RepID=A0A9Q8LHV1_PASFU|nr:uncharacterized protein CLAFUR5_05673 [Fulvia fulva]KAK4624241.1 hypothetical protein CLAFUR4_05526 [Fulvia fulva]KAK4625678.1 hypothetical protein CLAFUR0_05534 [Fulvia fulva]UJO17650.1 hypothetical protein CLAFUR5_05673 [Fulvia fulva]WPV14890.1 hypothetical protein CLAFUW4_05532 [Fulvia fulva]WPV30252.1 hypothetical protein CLAFUW7_05530 [Fulvia fulva]
MGTLTAGLPRLEHYCEHKLPTSCRLSSIGECCACYDSRAHSASYRTYVDGVGYVLRGTRWQSYCWCCKTFWENRVEASALRPAQTRIPEVPDQSAFLRRWYDFHRGYRVVSRDDGSEERVAVLGEDLRDVSPGFLPRTIEELRAGRERSEMEERERDMARQQHTVAESQQNQPGPTLEDTLDQLFQAASSEEERQHQPVTRPTVQSSMRSDADRANIHAQIMTPAASRNREYQARRIAALRRELNRMRNGIERVISGLRDLGENVPDHTEASARLLQLGHTLDNISDVPLSERLSTDHAQRTISSVDALSENLSTTQSDRTLAGMQARVEEARQQVNEAQRNREQAASELDVADQEHRASQSRLRALQDNMRSTENYMRLFGTREEMAAQGENYESPIGGMFTRAMERFRAAEEVRREERTLRQVLEGEDRVETDEALRRLASLQMREADVWGVPHEVNSQVAHQRGHQQHNGESSHNDHLQDYQALLDQQARELDSSGTAELHGTASNFPLSMLAGVAIDRASNLARTSAESPTNVAEQREAVPPTPAIVAGPPGHSLNPDPAINNDHGLDALFMLNGMLHFEDLSSMGAFLPIRNLPSDVSATAVIRRLIQSVEGNSLDEADAVYLKSLIQDEDIIWAVGLPTERNRRRRARGEHVTFTPDASAMAAAMSPGGQAIVHDIEIMAECFQMSAQVRRRSGVSGPAEMFSRLQAGRRDSEDRAILASMLQDPQTLQLCEQIHGQHNSQEQNERQAALRQELRDTARQGNHSRAELDVQRRATGVSTALAASRLAMGDSPAALFERLANRDDATRAAYRRLQDNGFNPARDELMATRSMTARRFREPELTAQPDFTGDFADEDEDDAADERVGLDARDSGRPEEPMTEEEMTVLLDCRICYSQRATICTLPCGHLTMCKWCSDQHSPVMAHDHTRPRRAANCPVCRKQIRQKVKVIRA